MCPRVRGARRSIQHLARLYRRCEISVGGRFEKLRRGPVQSQDQTGRVWRRDGVGLASTTGRVSRFELVDDVVGHTDQDVVHIVVVTSRVQRIRKQGHHDHQQPGKCPVPQPQAQTE